MTDQKLVYFKTLQAYSGNKTVNTVLRSSQETETIPFNFFECFY